MNICSEKMIENYLLYKNPLYAFRFPLALLVGIIIYGYSEMRKWSDNSYINQLLIPIASILVMMVVLDMISRMMISQKEKKRLMLLCSKFKSRIGINLAMLEHFDEKNGSGEGFENIDNNVVILEEIDDRKDGENKKELFDTSSQVLQQRIKDAMIMSNEIQGVEGFVDTKRLQIGAPMDYESNQQFLNINDDTLAVHSSPVKIQSQPTNSKCISGSNCCSLCSGQGDNPCNIIAPIPGPQWLPQTASAKQQELKSGKYTQSICPIHN